MDIRIFALLLTICATGLAKPQAFFPDNPLRPRNVEYSRLVKRAVGTTNGASAGASAGSYAGAGGYGGSGQFPTFDSRGAFQDNTPAGGNGGFGYGFGGFNPGFGGVDPGFAFQNAMDQQMRQLQEQIEAQHRAILDQTNQVNSGGFSGYPGPASAVSSINLGPGGGFQSGQISPVAPGIQSRFAEDLPAPSGNSFGVFSSSSSSSMTGPDGKTISRKQSTTGVNDNGKVSFRTVSD